MKTLPLSTHFPLITLQFKVVLCLYIWNFIPPYYRQGMYREAMVTMHLIQGVILSVTPDTMTPCPRWYGF